MFHRALRLEVLVAAGLLAFPGGAVADVVPPEQIQAGISLSASPNPVAPGGTVSFFATCNADTDIWDNLGHSGWGTLSFSMPVSATFTWSVSCAMLVEPSSGSITVTVDAGGGGGGGGGSGGGGDYSSYPDYDPNQVDGPAWDEAYQYQCLDTACSAVYALASQPMRTLSATRGCYVVDHLVFKNNLYGQRVWEFEQAFRYCVRGGKVSSVWNRIVDGRIRLPGYLLAVYPWEYALTSNTAPSTGVNPSVGFARGRFKMCGVFKIGPLCVTNEPYSKITVYGNGSAVCESNYGRARYCYERT